MDISSFEASVAAAAPPSGLSRALEALWHERRGDWDAAHHIAQDIDTEYGSWVHAYLHRREGDQSNAAYWYRRAGRPVAAGSLDDEWRVIVMLLLAA
jgi:hypothetical protein